MKWIELLSPFYVLLVESTILFSHLFETKIGSCTVAGYITCCSHGSCGGNPATCFCDEECYTRSDCCNDLQSICSEGIIRTGVL